MIKTTAPGKVVLWGEYAVLAGAAAGVMAVTGETALTGENSSATETTKTRKRARMPPGGTGRRLECSGGTYQFIKAGIEDSFTAVLISLSRQLLHEQEHPL